MNQANALPSELLCFRLDQSYFHLNFQGFLDGIVDLGLVRRIEKRDLARNFGFAVETYEGKTVVFSAITDGIRNSWITCLKKAAGLENQVQWGSEYRTSKY